MMTCQRAELVWKTGWILRILFRTKLTQYLFRTPLDANHGGIVGRKLTKGWVEYGAIDHTIIDKLQNEEESRVRLQGAEELNRCIRNMGDMQPLTSQIR